MNQAADTAAALNKAIDIIARREAVIRVLEQDVHEHRAALAYARSTRKVLFNLLGECLPLLHLDAQFTTDDESKKAIEALIEHIVGARLSVRAEEMRGRAKQRSSLSPKTARHRE
jgi:hypothetical protein